MGEGADKQNILEPWLTILGVGDNGLKSLSAGALELFDASQVIVAPERVLNVIDTGEKETIAWTFGVQETIDLIVSRRGIKTTILATGDPMHFGIGATLRRYFSADEMLVLPSSSGFSLAAAKMGWALQDVAQISLHGRAVSGLHMHVSPKRKIISLTSNARTIREVAKLLVERDFGGSQMTILEHIGGAKENISTKRANDIADTEFTCADFNMLAIECIGDQDAKIYSTVGGLPDEAFLHDGQLTKREVRAVTMAYLSPQPGELLWDVGAGCGSISIEWMRSSHGAEAIAIEKHDRRREFIKQNAKALGVPKLKIFQAQASDILDELESPNAIFIGGGITNDHMFYQCWAALKSGGRLVANSVTVESESLLIHYHSKLGGQLVRLQVSRTTPVGDFNGWKPFMPVTIWSVTKGYEA